MASSTAACGMGSMQVGTAEEGLAIAPPPVPRPSSHPVSVAILGSRLEGAHCIALVGDRLLGEVKVALKHAHVHVEQVRAVDWRMDRPKRLRARGVDGQKRWACCDWRRIGLLRLLSQHFGVISKRLHIHSTSSRAPQRQQPCAAPSPAEQRSCACLLVTSCCLQLPRHSANCSGPCSSPARTRWGCSRPAPRPWRQAARWSRLICCWAAHQQRRATDRCCRCRRPSSLPLSHAPTRPSLAACARSPYAACSTTGIQRRTAACGCCAADGFDPTRRRRIMSLTCCPCAPSYPPAYHTFVSLPPPLRSLWTRPTLWCSSWCRTSRSSPQCRPASCTPPPLSPCACCG